MATGEPTDRTLEAAMDLLLRIQAAPGDPLLRAELEAWCKADPAHARAWAQAEKTWGLVAEVPPAHANEWPGRNVRRPRMKFRLSIAAGAAIAACLMLLFVPALLINLGADYATSTAELREIALEDGSKVDLGPRSAIDIRFSPDRRAVTLIEGEAFFEVAANPRRPFVVNAGGVDVTVAGTAFDVRLSRDQVVVAVRNGIVEVRGEGGSPMAEVRLVAGDRVKVDRMTRKLARDKVPTEEVASWRERRLFVDGATVAEVVDELRRYRSGWIVVADSRLAAQRVTGLFDLDDTDRALGALVQPFDGKVQKLTPYLQILSAP